MLQRAYERIPHPRCRTQHRHVLVPKSVVKALEEYNEQSSRYIGLLRSIKYVVMACGVKTPQGSMETPSLSDVQVEQTMDYEKIIRLHDEICAGQHPHLKAPGSFSRKLLWPLYQEAMRNGLPRSVAGDMGSNHSKPAPDPSRIGISDGISKEPKHASSAPWDGTSPDTRASAANQQDSLKSKRTQIESALKEQLLQGLAEAKRKAEPENDVPDLDISEALEKAWAIVKHLPAPAERDRTHLEELPDRDSYHLSQQDNPFARVNEGALDIEEQATESDGNDVRVQHGINPPVFDHGETRLEPSHGVKGDQSPTVRPDAGGMVDVAEEPVAARRTDPQGGDVPQNYQRHSPGLRNSDRTDLVYEANLAESGQFSHRDHFESQQSPHHDVYEGRQASHGDNYEIQQAPHRGAYEGQQISHRDLHEDQQDLHRGQQENRHDIRHNLHDGQPERNHPLSVRTAVEPMAEYPAREQDKGVHAPSLDVQIIRSHIRSPVAPQPARVSPLAVARLPAVELERRNHHDSLSRPFSSRQSSDSPGHATGRLHAPKRQRVRRGEDEYLDERPRPAPRTLNSYIAVEPVSIKVEPISPGPMMVLDDHSASDAQQGYDSRGSDPASGRPGNSTMHRQLANDSPGRYEHVYAAARAGTTRVHGSFRQESVDRSRKHRADLQRYASFRGSRGPPSPAPYPAYTPAAGVRMRTASHGVSERSGPNNVRYYREEEEMGPAKGQYIRSEQSRSPRERYSPRAHGSVLMSLPSRPTISSYAVDESGRRFVEAPSSVYDQRPVAPSTRAYPVLTTSTRPRDSESYVERVHVPVRLSDHAYSERGYVKRSPPTSSQYEMRQVVGDGDRTEVMTTYRPRDFPTASSTTTTRQVGMATVPREAYVYAREIPEVRSSRGPYQAFVIPGNYVDTTSGPRSYETRYPSSGAGGVGVGGGSHRSEMVEHGGHSSIAGGGGRRMDVFSSHQHQPAIHHEYNIRATNDHHHHHDDHDHVDRHRREYIPAPAPAERYTYLAEPVPPPSSRFHHHPSSSSSASHHPSYHPPPPPPPPPAAAAAAPSSRRYVDEIRYIDDSRGRGSTADLPDRDGWRRASYHY